MSQTKRRRGHKSNVQDCGWSLIRRLWWILVFFWWGNALPKATHQWPTWYLQQLQPSRKPQQHRPIPDQSQVYGHRDSLSALAIVLAMWLGWLMVDGCWWWLMVVTQQVGCPISDFSGSNSPTILRSFRKETWKMRFCMVRWGIIFSFFGWEDIFFIFHGYFCAKWLFCIYILFQNESVHWDLSTFQFTQKTTSGGCCQHWWSWNMAMAAWSLQRFIVAFWQSTWDLMNDEGSVDGRDVVFLFFSEKKSRRNWRISMHFILLMVRGLGRTRHANSYRAGNLDHGFPGVQWQHSSPLHMLWAREIQKNCWNRDMDIKGQVGCSW